MAAEIGTVTSHFPQPVAPMTPWDLIVSALAAAASLIIVGFGVGIAVAVIKAAQRS